MGAGARVGSVPLTPRGRYLKVSDPKNVVDPKTYAPLARGRAWPPVVGAAPLERPELRVHDYSLG